MADERYIDLNTELKPDKQMCDPAGTAWKQNVTMLCPKCGKSMHGNWLGNTLESMECICGHTIITQD